MWRWIKPWIDWVTTDVLPITRTRPHGQAIHTRYEKSGQSFHDLPVPWNADSVVIEVLLRLPLSARRKTDFSLRFPGSESFVPEAIRQETEDRHRLIFQLPVPISTTAGELLWKHHLLTRVAVPVLTETAFQAALRITLPTVSVMLGSRTLAAQTFVASQCRGLSASIVLQSPTPLAPVAEMGLRAVFRSERSAVAIEVPVILSRSQLASREALLTVRPSKYPKRVGMWNVSWRLGDREICTQRVQGIPAKRFEQSLRVADSRFVVADKAGVVKVVRQAPLLSEITRIGPCFLVASSEVGMAGICRLQVHPMVPGDARPAQLMEQDFLVTDGPSVFAPGMLEVSTLGRVNGFELRHKNRVLGVASLSPIPAATINAEGGFKPAPEFGWSTAAEDELTERLSRLMNGGS